MTEQEINNLKELYAELCTKARDSQRLTCQLTGEREVARTELYNALLKLFEESPKYQCCICGKKLQLLSEPCIDGETSHYLYCEKCKTRYSLTYDGLTTLLAWFQKCNQEIDNDK